MDQASSPTKISAPCSLLSLSSPRPTHNLEAAHQVQASFNHLNTPRLPMGLILRQTSNLLRTRSHSIIAVRISRPRTLNKEAGKEARPAAQVVRPRPTRDLGGLL